MAKIRHNNFIDTLVDLSSHARRQGVIQLQAEDDRFSGRSIRISGEDLFYFSTTGYLGLELNPKIKQAAVEAIYDYGTQFPLSKTYVSHPLYRILEERLFEMYRYEVLVTKNSTLGHIGVVPSLVRDEDGVILDHQVHWSVQNAVQHLKSRGIPIEMIRHSDMDMLEEKIKKLGQNCKNIWYFADGVYSMFGDVAPIDHLKELCARYPQLHLYYDDVHGMSWTGQRGTGFVLDQYEVLPENVVVFTTMSKSFGANGSTMVTSNKAFLRRVKSFGGPLTFSAQLDPASVGAAIASANIHLSEEIEEMQQGLMERIILCNSLLSETKLPIVQVNDTPVFYVGTGAPEVGYNFTQKLYEAGCYVNMGLFPAVPVKKTGIRFTISLHNRPEDIRYLIQAMDAHYWDAIEEKGVTANQVRRLFSLPLVGEPGTVHHRPVEELVIEKTDSINKVNVGDWNSALGGIGCFDSAGMRFLETLFQNNELDEHNWDFRYLMVKDHSGQVVLATFFSCAIWKEDMLASEPVSREIEKLRQSNPYVHTSKVLTMGTLFTEGEQLYVAKDHPLRGQAIDYFFTYIQELDQELLPDTIAIRDFRADNDWLSEALDEQGFVRFAMPETNYFDLSRLQLHHGDLMAMLSPRSRKHFKKDVLPFVGRLHVEIKKELSDAEVVRCYELYQMVWSNNIALNTFCYPERMVMEMNQSPDWEFIVAFDPHTGVLVGVMFCYRNLAQTYCPSLIGMDYKMDYDFSIYRQMLYHTIMRGYDLGYSGIDFGFSASFEKTKLGAQSIEQVAYLQAKDNYAFEMLELLNPSTSK